MLVLRLNNNGCAPLHVACRQGVPTSVFNHLVELDKSVLTIRDKRGELSLQKACRGGHTELINLLIDMHPPSFSERNNANDLPIFILCKRFGKDEGVLEPVEYTGAIWRLLLAHPETVAI